MDGWIFFFNFYYFLVVFVVLPRVFPLNHVNNSGSGWLEKRKACRERIEVELVNIDKVT